MQYGYSLPFRKRINLRMRGGGGHVYMVTEGSGNQTSMGSASGAYRDMRAIIFVIALS